MLLDPNKTNTKILDSLILQDDSGEKNNNFLKYFLAGAVIIALMLILYFAFSDDKQHTEQGLKNSKRIQDSQISSSLIK